MSPSPKDPTRTRALKLLAELQSLIADWDRPPQPKPPTQVHLQSAGDRTAPRLLTLDEVMFRLGVSRTTVFRLVAEDELPSVKVGKSRRFPSDAVDGYVAALMVNGEDASDG